MKKILAIVCVIAMMLSLTACATSNQVPQEAAPAAEAAAPAEAKAEAAAPAEAKAEAAPAAEAAAPAADDPLLEGKTGQEAPPKKCDHLKVGFCPTAMNTQYQLVIDGFNQCLYDNQWNDIIDFIVQAPSGQSAIDEQVEIVEGWIQQQFDVICMCTANEDAMEPIYREATELGIPIFEFNTPALDITNPYYVSNVGYDQREAGYAMGEWLCKTYTDDINVAVLEGLPGTHNTERLGGFNDAIAANNGTNIHIVASQPADWVRDKGQSVTENLLVSNPEIEFIWGMYDEMALGAVAACKDAGRTDIIITGYDNIPDANEAIRRGDMTATVDTASKQMGYSLCEAVKKYAMDGEMVPKTINQEVKVYDQGNIDEFSLDNYTFVQK